MSTTVRNFLQTVDDHVDNQCAVLHNACMTAFRTPNEARDMLAEVLKRARGYALMSQDQLAHALGISRRSVSAYESGETEPPAIIVLEWLSLCRRPLDDLADVATDPTADELQDSGPRQRRNRCDALGARRPNPGEVELPFPTHDVELPDYALAILAREERSDLILDLRSEPALLVAVGQ